MPWNTFCTWENWDFTKQRGSTHISSNLNPEKVLWDCVCRTFSCSTSSFKGASFYHTVPQWGLSLIAHPPQTPAFSCNDSITCSFLRNLLLMNWLKLGEAGIWREQWGRLGARRKRSVEEEIQTEPDKNVRLLLFSMSNIPRHGLWYSEDLMYWREKHP